jgi:beta-lactamase regulating signal transducer with metallopeptidase domain
MLVDWLYTTTLELSLLIGLVLLLRPFVRRTLGARAAYWLWAIPVIRAVLVDRPEWPRTLVESVGAPGGEWSLTIYPSPDVWILPAAIPWLELWIAGVALCIALRVAGVIKFRSLLAKDSLPLDLPAEILTLLPPRLQRCRPRYFATDMPGTPFVTGLLRPQVYLPTDFAQRFSVEERRWVVQHELTHAARGDLWVQLVFELLRSVFWFNPIVHVAASAVRDDQELACDQTVLRSSDHQDRYTYGRALMIGAGAQLFPTLLSFFGNQKERVAMIGKHKASPRRDVVGIGLCALVGIFALTKAPVSVAELVSGEPLTLSFSQLPMTKIVELIMDFSGGGEVLGLEQLSGMAVTVRITSVPAREALQRVLGCAGFGYEERGEAIAIVPLQEGAATPACGDLYLERSQ